MKKLIACVVILALCLTAFAACSNNEAESPLTAAKDYLYAMYKDKAEATPSDYQVVGIVKIGEDSFNVEWTTNVTEGITIVVGDDHMVTIDVNEQTPEEISYTLTATIKGADGKTETVSFDRKVPAFKELSWQEYIDAASGDTVVVKGVVTGIMSKTRGNSSNCLYLQDNDGGYYVYGMAADPVEEGIEIGMTIRVSGSKEIYSGTHEVMNAVVEILDTNKTEVTPVDYTDRYQNAENLKDANLVEQQAMLVTVKGVEITGQDTGSGYYKFKMGDLETYVRISSSVCPLLKEDQATFAAEHASHLGWTADVTGILCVYDGAFYLTPVSVDAISYISLPTRSDAEMVEFEKGNLTMISTVSADTTIDLSTTGIGYSQVAISWTSDNDCAVVADGKLTITLPDADTVVKLTATLTSGDATDTVEFEIKIVVREPSYEEIVDLAYGLAENESLEGTYRLYGIITEINTEYSEEYKNITVTIQVGGMEDKLIQCFRLKGEGCENLAVGDTITVEGALKNYKGTVEFDSGCALIGLGEIPDQTKTLENAYALAAGEGLASPSVLKGVVASIDTEYSAEYNNITVTIIVDGLTDYPIQCFRLTGEGIDTLAVGDEIAVLGTIKNYKGTIEFDSGCRLIPAEDFVQIRTLLAGYALEQGGAMAGPRTLTGVIATVDNEYSAEYNNITVTIVVDGLEDYKIMCFRLTGEGIDTLAEGDTITVTGVLTNYKGTIEFNSGCTLDAVVKAG